MTGSADSAPARRRDAPTIRSKPLVPEGVPLVTFPWCCLNGSLTFQALESPPPLSTQASEVTIHMHREQSGTWRTPLLWIYMLLLIGNGVSKAQDTADGHRSEASLGAAMVGIEQPYRDVKPAVIPVPWINWRVGRLHMDGITAGYDLVQDQNWSASLVIEPRFDQISPRDSVALSGIRSRSMSADGGVSVARNYDGTLFSLNAVHDILGKSHGSLVSGDVSRAMRFTRSSLVVTVGIEWEDRRSTAYYFGVSPSEADRLRPAYTPASGLSAHLGVFYFRSLSRHWTGIAGLRYVKLGRAMANSPLVDSDHSAIAVIGATYNFGA